MKQSNPAQKGKQKNKAKNNCLTQVNQNPNFLREMRVDQIKNFVPRLVRELLQNKIDLDKYAVVLYHAGLNVLPNGNIVPSTFQQVLLETLLANSMAAQNRANAFMFYRDNYILPTLQQGAGQITDKTRELTDANINFEMINAKIYYDMYQGFVNMYRTGNYAFLLPVIAGNQQYQYSVYQADNDPVQYLIRELKNAQGQGYDNNRKKGNRQQNDKRNFNKNNRIPGGKQGSIYNNGGQYPVFPSGQGQTNSGLEQTGPTRNMYEA